MTQGPKVVTESSELSTPLRGAQRNSQCSYQEIDTELVIVLIPWYRKIL
jgi:hypothetical protein